MAFVKFETSLKSKIKELTDSICFQVQTYVKNNHEIEIDTNDLKAFILKDPKETSKPFDHKSQCPYMVKKKSGVSAFCQKKVKDNEICCTMCSKKANYDSLSSFLKDSDYPCEISKDMEKKILEICTARKTAAKKDSEEKSTKGTKGKKSEKKAQDIEYEGVTFSPFVKDKQTFYKYDKFVVTFVNKKPQLRFIMNEDDECEEFDVNDTDISNECKKIGIRISNKIESIIKGVSSEEDEESDKGNDKKKSKKESSSGKSSKKKESSSDEETKEVKPLKKSTKKSVKKPVSDDDNSDTELKTIKSTSDSESDSDEEEIAKSFSKNRSVKAQK